MSIASKKRRARERRRAHVWMKHQAEFDIASDPPRNLGCICGTPQCPAIAEYNREPRVLSAEVK